MLSAHWSHGRYSMRFRPRRRVSCDFTLRLAFTVAVASGLATVGAVALARAVLD